MGWFTGWRRNEDKSNKSQFVITLLNVHLLCASVNALLGFYLILWSKLTVCVNSFPNPELVPPCFSIRNWYWTSVGIVIFILGVSGVYACVKTAVIKIRLS